jgi:hypothetical protein
MSLTGPVLPTCHVVIGLTIHGTAAR